MIVQQRIFISGPTVDIRSSNVFVAQVRSKYEIHVAVAV